MQTVYFAETGPRNTLAPHNDEQGRTIVGPLWLAGRLDGLAGTVRYDLSDDDREVLRMAARCLEEAAGLLAHDGDGLTA